MGTVQTDPAPQRPATGQDHGQRPGPSGGERPGHGGPGDGATHDGAAHDHTAHDHAAHDGAAHEGAAHDHGGSGGGALAGLRHRLGHLLTPHGHDSADKVDAALRGSREGIRALWISLLVLSVTAALQAVVYLWSGSIALLGDTLHNVADALTAVPLGIAFLVGRRPADRRYTYGYGRAEDLAGIVIVALIAASAVIAGYEAVTRLLHPAEVTHLAAVAGAAVIGFAGNELVARYRITVGRRIGSAALVADGLHARADGFTSLAVLLGAGGVALGWRWADPVVGLAITAAILFVLRDAGREVYHRLMDAVDPALVDAVEQTLRATPGVLDVGAVHLRWIGHNLRAECTIVIDGGLDVTTGHDIAVEAEHRVMHELPKLTGVAVHADPASSADRDPHAALDHHRATGPAATRPGRHRREGDVAG
jgi:cation diffusion facilitator family transporter